MATVKITPLLMGLIIRRALMPQYYDSVSPPIWLNHTSYVAPPPQPDTRTWKNWKEIVGFITKKFRCYSAAQALSFGFRWGITPESFEAWSVLHRRTVFGDYKNHHEFNRALVHTYKGDGEFESPAFMSNKLKYCMGPKGTPTDRTNFLIPWCTDYEKNREIAKKSPVIRTAKNISLSARTTHVLDCSFIEAVRLKTYGIRRKVKWRK